MSKQTPSDPHIATDGNDMDPVVAALNSNPLATPYSSTSQPLPGSGRLSFDDESPYLDFDNDGEFDDSFDLDPNARMIGDLPDGEQLPTNDELHDKRKTISDKDNDHEGGGKRQEGGERTSKRPGRKPLTSEPTSKRKAQNRAAQRAFRERKEKHLRDLETKVEDLEKASEATSHENDLLRAQVARLQVELKEYRKRLSWISSGGASRSNSLSLVSNNQQSDFHFEFPKFGDMPHVSSPTTSTGQSSKTGSNQKSGVTNPTRTLSATASLLTQSSSQPQLSAQVSGQAASGQGSAQTQTQPQTQASLSTSQSQVSKTNGSIASSLPLGLSDLGQSDLGQSDNIDSLSSLFSPSMLESARHGSFNSYFTQYQSTALNAAVTVSNSSVSNSNSPTSSGDSQHSTSSICTSPESSLSSPANKVLDAGTALNTINETQNESSGFGIGTTTLPTTTDFTGSSALNPNNSFSFLASQPSHSSFDPALFGDFRETQDSILSQDFGSFFNDAYPLPDLGSPTHNFNEVSSDPSMPATTQPIPRTSLLKQVEAAREGNEEVVPDNDKPMSCNKIWDRLQSMEKFRNGEIDIDSLCSELRAKAKCSEGGAVVDKRDVDRILGRAR